MRRRTPPALVAPPAPSQRLLEPVVEDWVSPREVSSLEQAQALASTRWRDGVNRWKATPGAYLALGIDWDRAFLVGDLEPTFRDREAFEWVMALST